MRIVKTNGEGTTMKVKDLAFILTNKLKVVDFSKVRTHQDFHELVHSAISDQMTMQPWSKMAGPLELGIWSITLGSGYDRKVMKYARDFKKYETCKTADRGYFSNVRVEPFSAEIGNMDLNYIEDYFSRAEKAERVSNLTKHIKDLKSDLVKAEKALEELTHG